jgi:hypothetical protein
VILLSLVCSCTLAETNSNDISTDSILDRCIYIAENTSAINSVNNPEQREDDDFRINHLQRMMRLYKSYEVKYSNLQKDIKNQNVNHFESSSVNQLKTLSSMLVELLANGLKDGTKYDEDREKISEEEFQIIMERLIVLHVAIEDRIEVIKMRMQSN